MPFTAARIVVNPTACAIHHIAFPGLRIFCFPNFMSYLETSISFDLSIAAFSRRLVPNIVPAPRRQARGLAAAVVAIVLGPLALAQGTVPPPGFTLSGPDGSISSLTIKRGETGSLVFTITPSGGFTGTVTNTAGIISTPANCLLTPWVDFGSSSQITITGPQPATATLKIYGDGLTHLSSLQQQKRLSSYGPWGAALACILLAVPCRRRWRWLSKLCGLALLAAWTCGIMACGNPHPSVTRGDYVIRVTSYSEGGLSTSNTVKLTVQ